MPKTIQENITSTDSILIKEKQLVKAEVENPNISMYTGGGLIPALINSAVISSRASDAEELIQAIEAELPKNYCIQKQIYNTLSSISGTCQTMELTPLEEYTFDQDEDNFIQNCTKRSKSDALMILNFSYVFNPDFSVLKATLKINIVSSSKKLSSLIKEKYDENNTIYKNIISSSYKLPRITDEKEVNAQTWKENSAELMRNAFEKNLLEIKEKLIWSLNNTHLINKH